MGPIEGILGPNDVEGLPPERLEGLAEEVGTFLVENISKMGGHLGPSLGVVELTTALHRVFSSPSDVLVFDIGYQSYTHKTLTGHHDFPTLRQEGGLSGYPARKESVHDVVENSHASTAFSWVDEIARSFEPRGKDRCVVVAIGNGAMTGEMAWGALNNVAEDPKRSIVVVLNDNDRSYAPTVGGIVREFEPARRLDNFCFNKNYEALLKWTERHLFGAGVPERATYGALHSIRKDVKDIFVDTGVLNSFGLRHIDPVDGYNLKDPQEALALTKNFEEPVAVHTITEKGRGYHPVEENADDRSHAVGRIHPKTGLPVKPVCFGWTVVFAKEIAQITHEHEDAVNVTAAMLRPIGLDAFADAFPERVIDVGIAEQHALAMAAGLAYAGCRPVVALYSTFIDRGFDQLLTDVALHNAPVTVVLDHARITGDDGSSYSGMWGLSPVATVPDLRVAAPRDVERLRKPLREMLNVEGPTLMRYSKGEVPPLIEVMGAVGGTDLVYSRDGARTAVVAAGAVIPVVIEVAGDRGNTNVLDPRWALLVDPVLVETLFSYDVVVTIENGFVSDGVGSEIVLALGEAGYGGRLRYLEIGRRFLPHASRALVRRAEGLTPEAIGSTIDSVWQRTRS